MRTGGGTPTRKSEEEEMADNGRQAGPRCIALVGPFASGKTSLLEAILMRTGAITRQGHARDGNMVGDASPEARTAGMSIELNVAETEYMGDRYTFIDCPGSVEFSLNPCRYWPASTWRWWSPRPTPRRSPPCS
jgi:translation elongation factor EF-G